jgi:ribosome-associated protein
VKPQRIPHPGKNRPAKARDDDEDADGEDDDVSAGLGFLGQSQGEDVDEVGDDADDHGDDADDGEDAEDDGEEFAEAGDVADADGIIDTESPGFSERKPTFTLGRKAGGSPGKKPSAADAGARKPSARDPKAVAKDPASAHDSAGVAAGSKEKLDGEGRRYVTLAQFLKHIDVAPTGGAAKAMARSGTILVGGEAESRPGRKLHQGDEVIVDGKPYRVDLG